MGNSQSKKQKDIEKWMESVLEKHYLSLKSGEIFLCITLHSALEKLFDNDAYTRKHCREYVVVALERGGRVSVYKSHSFKGEYIKKHYVPRADEQTSSELIRKDNSPVLTAFIDENMLVILIMTKDSLYPKVRSALEQVSARKGQPIIICNEGETKIDGAAKTISIPSTADCIQGILTIIPLQLLSYHLAKSVTVE